MVWFRSFKTEVSLVLRGRFTNTISYANPADLSNAVMNTARANNSIDASAGIATFSLNSNSSNGFAMSGGTLSVYDVCITTGTPLAFLVNSPSLNINVTGGTVQVIPTTGSGTDADYYVNSTAPFNNFTVNRVSGTRLVQLNLNPITVLNNLNIASGVFQANNLDVTVGGDFTIASGTTYTPGTNTTTLNGTGTQTFSVFAAQAFNDFTIDKPAGVAVNFAGTSGTAINVANNFRLALGTLNDNGNTINLSGNAYNSGLHAGTGKFAFIGTVAQTIDGNGIFNNVELNNNTGAAGSSPVSLIANTTVNGVLTFSRDRLFNIGIYNLLLNSGATIVNGSATRYIKTAGNAGDGGLTKVFSTTGSFIYPVGAPTLVPVRAIKYTPATIGITSSPTTYGAITVVPVGYEHPATTVNGRSLTYFWRLESSGFSGLAAGSITHNFVYSQTDVVGTEANYIPTFYNRTTSSWNNGAAANINTATNTITDWAASSNTIDGDFTAGDAAFGTTTTYYSRASSAWNLNTTWSTDPVLRHTGAPAAGFPGINDIAIVGNGNTVNLTANASCASLQIQAGSVLDIYTWTGSVFSMVMSHPLGNGLFRLTTTQTASVNIPKLFSFPLNSDFTDFNNNHGTTEYYDIGGGVGELYILPPNITTYGNLILTAHGGDNLVLPNNSLTTVLGDLTCGGDNPNAWIAVSWNTNIAPYNSGVYDPTIEKTIHITGNLNVNTGTLIFMPEIVPQHFVVDGNLIVGTNGYIDVQPATYGVPPGPPLANTIAIGGNFTNNSSGAPYVRLLNSGYYCNLTFQGSANASISGTSISTTINNVTVNKGSSQATTLTCNIGGTFSTPTNNWLTLQNGTFIYARTNPNADFTISTTTPFTIPTNAGLTINLPSNTGNRNILIGNAANDNGDLLLSGKLTIINGNVYVGSTAGTNNNNNDIEYTSSGASSIDIQGGRLFVNGQIRRDPSNAGGILQYSQSGASTVQINGQNSNNTNAKLEVLNAGSNFTMTNGTLTIVRGNGSTTTPSSPFGDLYLRPETSSVTGGTIVFSQVGIAVSAPQNYFLDATVPLDNLTITGINAANPATVRLLVSPLILNGNMLISANSVLNSNNIDITFNGNLTNTPGVPGYIAGTNVTTFSSPATQSITGATNFNDMVVSPGTSLTLGSPSTISNNLTLSTGNFILGSNVVNLKGDLQNDATFSDVSAAGNGIILSGTTLQTISGAGSYARLTVNNTAGAQIINDVTLTENLTLAQGILDIKKNLITLGVNSLVVSSPASTFGATKMITSDGVFSNVGLRKFFSSGVQPLFLYPIGTSGKYTPAALKIDANSTVGYVRINNINSRHPALISPANALAYYWEVQSSGISGFSGSLVLNYLQGDVVGDEPNYLTARLMVPGTTWNIYPGVDAGLNTITSTYAAQNNISGEYTAGTASSFFNNIPTYTSNKDGNWTDNTIWDQTAGDTYPCPVGGPNGFIVIVKDIVTINTNRCYAYKTTINGRLEIMSPSYGHNLGTVDGNGTLYLESGSFPAGVFTSFLSCANNGTVEYGGTGTYTIVADLYDNIPNIVFSGTGTRVLPNKDLTICNLLRINGPILDNSIYNRKLTIQGTMSRLAGTFRSGSGAGAVVSFAGSAPQTIGGAALGDFTGTSAFNNLEINNSAGLRINNGGAVEVAGTLFLTNGLINTSSTRRLTLTNPSNNCVFPSGGSITSFIDGPLIKDISQYDNFVFPIGKSGTPNILGNKLNISNTQSGPLLWSAEYITPNPTSASITSPLLGVSALEFFRIGATAGSRATININWTPSSDVTPIITGGMSNIRLAKYNTGTSSWTEIPTSSTGDNSNGTATSTVLLTSTGTDDYTLGSVTDLKPRAKLSPLGPICGNTGIPITFTAPYAIPFNYVVNYTIDGVAQLPVTITAATPLASYILPTPGSGLGPWVYRLTDFTYNVGVLPKAGVVDATPVTAYAAPTIANAGADQAWCGTTTTFLAANLPTSGVGIWSIVGGSGGTLITPTSNVSQFIGLNGVSYTLRWTISNGTCISSDDVIINFTIPAAPGASPTQSFCGSPTVANLVATPPGGYTVDWFTTPTGGGALGSGIALINGNTYYAESNGGGICRSLTRTAVLVTINPVPVPGLVGTNLVCINSTGNIYSTEAGKSNYIWTVIGGSITAGGLGTNNTATVTWNTAGIQSISVNYQDVGGCTAASPTLLNITVTANMTVGAASATPTLCISTPLTAITHATTLATGIGAATGLPAGVTAAFAANTITISGTPTAAGVFNYSIPLTGGCGTVNATGTITVTANMTVGAASATPTLCISTPLTAITHATTLATGIGAATGLPAGVTAAFAANTITISGTPTAAGVFNYSIPLTGGCGTVNATGTITVTANMTVGAASATPTLCISTPLTAITHATTLATGIGAATGLPAGVTAAFAANTITISGTPTAAGVFNYSIPLTGGCGTVNATGTITVTANMTVGAASATPTLCISTPLTAITHATTLATGIGAATGLPAGVTAAFAANTITISGTPTAAGVFNYSIPLTGGCGTVNATGTITVTANMTVGAASATPTLCISTPLTAITHATTLATGIGAATGLPAGVTAAFAANTITISGTPTAAGVFNYSIPLTGGCGTVNATGTITVTANMTVGAASATPTLCISTPLTAITHATTLATGIGAATGLPAGVTAAFAANTITISGTPTAAGVFNYSIPLTGGCGTVNATGTITVTANMTVGAASATPTLCISTPLTAITHATTLATGIGAATGLPAGVTAAFAANTITISGTPTAAGVFNYSIPLTGGCGTVNATGTITVTANMTVGAASATPTLCISTPLTAITHATTLATGIGAATGLPAGVTAAFAANTITISGTPTAAGVFNYSIPLTGGCGTVNATGTITVTANMTVGAASATPTLCISTPLTAITHATTLATGIGAATGLPAGVTAAFAANTITISGTPTAAGVFNYSIPLTGGCGTVNATGTITVTANMTVGAASATPTLCISTPLTAITHATTLATGIGAATGLPAGVTAAFAANTITISGTPTAAGVFNYSIPLTGGCGTVNATGTITVTANMTVGAASATPTLCISTPLTAITHATTLATGIGAATGLPAGVTAAFAANTITISGTPTAAGVFNYSIPLTGGCGTVNATGTITVTANMTVGAASATPTLCISTPLTAITHATTLATGIGAATGLPAGVTAAFAANTITISGTPTAAGVFNYSIPLTGGCGTVNATGTITVTANMTVGAASATPTLCISTPLTAITHATTLATGIGAATGLPAGVTAAFAANTITISGTPTAAGVFNYSIPLTGGCGTVNATGTITVTANMTVGAASATPTLCISTPLTAITHATTLATGIGAATGLPAGVTAAFAANTITISGTPTAAGVFNYSIPLTGGCGTVNATGTITVTANMTVGAASATPTLCISTPLTAITHATTLATGIGAATGLPAGVTAAFAANTITISGTPTAAGVFNYSIPLTGGCGTVNATGTITVTANMTVGAASATPTLCISTPLTAITHATTLATGIGAATGLPAGVTAAFAANTITISGTPTAAGVFNYSIPLTGGCGTVNATGTITVTANMTVGAASATPTLCISTPLTAITHATTLATGIGAATGLPAGVTAAFAANTITISGTPTAAGVFNYSIPLTGGCGTVNATGTITVTANMTVGAASATPTLCISTPLTAITHATTLATGIGAATGLPAGVTAAFAANTITISGTPTAAGVFNYSIPLTGGCGTVNATGTITVTANMTVGAASATPTLCISTPLTAITHATTLATGIGAATGLPAGVTAAFAANTITISGTPTAAGVFNYSIPLTGGCGTVNATGTITVTANMTVGAASATPTLCISTPLTAITHATTLATGIGAATGLPAGVTAAFAANTITISGTPTAAGVFNYSIPLTGGCGTVNATGTITVTANMTVGAASATPTLCISTPLTAITHATTLATGIGAATGLPAGVTAAFAANTITISGTPTAAGVFNYSIPLTGGCGTVNATGTITVTANMTVGAASATPTLCISTPLTAITHATTLATGIGAATGLPAGVTAAFAANTITISGTPTAAGVFNYSIPLTGGCGTVNATGTITVTANMTVGAASATPTLCISTPLTAITHATTLATGIGAATGLPAGVTAAFAANTITISGTPTAAGVFNYSIPLTGGCGTVNATGTITVNALPVATATNNGPICVGTPLTLTGPAGMTTYSWTGPLGYTSTLQSPTVSASATVGMAGVYSLVVTNANGCSSIAATTTVSSQCATNNNR